MAVLDKEGLTAALKSLLGDRDDDDALKLLEDLTDTYDSYNDGEDWKAKFEENDKAWRDRYKARFFDGDESNDAKDSNESTESDESEDAEKITVDDLFEDEDEEKEKEGD